MVKFFHHYKNLPEALHQPGASRRVAADDVAVLQSAVPAAPDAALQMLKTRWKTHIMDQSRVLVKSNWYRWFSNDISTMARLLLGHCPQCHLTAVMAVAEWGLSSCHIAIPNFPLYKDAEDRPRNCLLKKWFVILISQIFCCQKVPVVSTKQYLIFCIQICCCRRSANLLLQKNKIY